MKIKYKYGEFWARYLPLPLYFMKLNAGCRRSNKTMFINRLDSRWLINIIHETIHLIFYYIEDFIGLPENKHLDFLHKINDFIITPYAFLEKTEPMLLVYNQKEFVRRRLRKLAKN